MKFIAIIQARLASQRLPRKVIAPLEPERESPLVLEHLIQRISQAKQVDKIIVAISETEYPFFDKMPFLQDISIKTGETHDVLSRFLKASQDSKENDYIIRITADNPFIDYQVLEKNISFVKEKNPDYSYPAWLPLGMGFEICQLRILKKIGKLNLSSANREHVTTYIKENPKQYNIQPMRLDRSIYPLYKNIRLTIDEPVDLVMAQNLYKYFEKKNIYFCATKVNQLYREKPELLSLNQHVQQKSHHLSEVVS